MNILYKPINPEFYGQCFSILLPVGVPPGCLAMAAMVAPKRSRCFWALALGTASVACLAFVGGATGREVAGCW